MRAPCPDPATGRPCSLDHVARLWFPPHVAPGKDAYDRAELYLVERNARWWKRMGVMEFMAPSALIPQVPPEPIMRAVHTYEPYFEKKNKQGEWKEWTHFGFARRDIPSWPYWFMAVVWDSYGAHRWTYLIHEAESGEQQLNPVTATFFPHAARHYPRKQIRNAIRAWRRYNP